MQTNKRVQVWPQAGLAIMLVAILLGLYLIQRPNQPRTTATNKAPLNTRALLGSQPLSFEPNLGQFDSSVRYLARGADYHLFLTDAEAVMVLHESLPAAASTEKQPAARSLAQAAAGKTATLRFRWQGGKAGAQLSAGDKLVGVSNYLLGNDASRWRENVPSYASVSYQGVYDGIDLAWYAGQAGQLEYDFIVNPGADPAQIRLTVAGADRIETTGGDLLLHTAVGDVRQAAAHIYQRQADGTLNTVAGSYGLQADGSVSFVVPNYNHALALVIDPTLGYSTYLGSTLNDTGSAITVDGAGNAYVIGSTTSTDFPTLGSVSQTTYGGGLNDAFVTKIDGTGARVYSTYLGGSSSDVGIGIAVDGAGSAYATGYTSSNDFPILGSVSQNTYGGGGDAFVTKLNAGGGRVYSTFLGGNNSDIGNGIGVDSAGKTYVTGHTASPNFPILGSVSQSTYGGSGDAFVTAISATGARIYSTYLGGNSVDYGQAIAVDSSDNAYVAGYTGGGFPTLGGGQNTYGGGGYDAFVTEMNSSGVQVYSTYLGGSAQDRGMGIAIGAGYAYVTGQTEGGSFPLLNADQTSYGGGLDDAFVTALGSTGARVYSTFLGGSGFDGGRGIAVDGAGNTSVVGSTESNNFPIRGDVPQPTFGGGGSDAFVARIDARGVRLYSTYLGGNTLDQGAGSAVDSAGNTYVTGITGGGFQIAGSGSQTNYGGGGSDAFVSRLDQVTPVPTRTPAGATATPQPTACPVQFNDAQADSPFYQYVRCLACRNILSGYPCGGTGEPCPGSYFRPNANVTRGQAAKIISNAANYADNILPAQQTFADVPADSPFWVFVERVFLHGAISGYPCGAPGEPCPDSYFRPGANLTRGQLAKIATSVAGYTDPTPSTPSFSDVPSSSPFYIYIERAHTHNIISGYACGGVGEPCPGTYFRPGLNVTRGQTAKIVGGTFFPNCQTPARPAAK